jgi:hypothetical protein
MSETTGTPFISQSVVYFVDLSVHQSLENLKQSKDLPTCNKIQEKVGSDGFSLVRDASPHSKGLVATAWEEQHGKAASPLAQSLCHRAIHHNVKCMQRRADKSQFQSKRHGIAQSGGGLECCSEFGYARFIAKLSEEFRNGRLRGLRFDRG